MSGEQRREEILEFVKGFLNDQGYPPTIYEIAEAVYGKRHEAASAVAEHLDMLAASGEIEKVAGSRGIFPKNYQPQGKTIFSDALARMDDTERRVALFLARPLRRPPSYRELCQEVGISLGAEIEGVLRRMTRKGFLQPRRVGTSRTLKLADSILEASGATGSAGGFDPQGSRFDP